MQRTPPPSRPLGGHHPSLLGEEWPACGLVKIEHTLAKMGAERLWKLLHSEPYVNALGALTGNQAMQMVRAGLQAIYLSGWQVAADNNAAGAMYPTRALPRNSVPTW